MTLSVYRTIFQNRNYCRFWLGFTFSCLGDALTQVAFTWFVYDLTHSAGALGWLQFFYSGPVLIGGFLAGWLLDRFGHRQVMIVDNLVRGAAILLVPLLHWLGWLQLWHIYLAAAVYGLLWMISLAGGPSLVPNLVAEDQLVTANALEMIGFTIGGVLGPLLGGWLINKISAPNVVAIDVISYFVFAALLWVIRPAPSSLGQARAAVDGQGNYSLGDAIRLMLRSPILLSLTLMFMALNIGGGMLTVWLPIFTAQVLKGDAQLYGTLLAAKSCFEVASTLLAGSMVVSITYGKRIAIAQALSGAALLFFLLGSSPWLAAVGLSLWGGISAPLTIWAQTIRMKIIPAHLRGRTFALLRTLMQGGNPIGGALAGFLLPLLGISTMIALSAIVTGLPGLIGLSVKALRQDSIR